MPATLQTPQDQRPSWLSGQLEAAAAVTMRSFAPVPELAGAPSSPHPPDGMQMRQKGPILLGSAADSDSRAEGTVASAATACPSQTVSMSNRPTPPPRHRGRERAQGLRRSPGFLCGRRLLASPIAATAARVRMASTALRSRAWFWFGVASASHCWTTALIGPLPASPLASTTIPARPVGQQGQAGPPAPVGALVVGEQVTTGRHPEAVAEPPAALGGRGGGERKAHPGRAEHPSSRRLATRAGQRGPKERARSGAVVTRPAAACSAKAKSGRGRPSASCGRAVCGVRDHRKLLAVIPSGSSTSVCR